MLNAVNIMNKILYSILDVIGQGSVIVQDKAIELKDDVEEKVRAYRDGTYHPADNIKKKVVKTGTAAVVVAAILSGLVFSGTDEILQESSGEKYNRPPVILEIGEYANAEVDDADDDADEQKTTKLGIIARFKQAVLSLPRSVRLVIVAPLYLLGVGIMTGISFLWNIIFSTPIGAFIASFAAGFAILAGLYVATAKILFPEIPIRKLLTKKTVLAIASTAIILSVIDSIAPAYWHAYPFAAGMIKLVIGASVIGLISLRVRAVYHRSLNKLRHPLAS